MQYVDPKRLRSALSTLRAQTSNVRLPRITFDTSIKPTWDVSRVGLLYTCNPYEADTIDGNQSAGYFFGMKALGNMPDVDMYVYSLGLKLAAKGANNWYSAWAILSPDLEEFPITGLDYAAATGVSLGHIWDDILPQGYDIGVVNGPVGGAGSVIDLKILAMPLNQL